MVCLFDRFFSNDLTYPAEELAVCDFYPHPRIRVLVFKDDPCYEAIFIVDNNPALKETMVEGLSQYYDKTCADSNLHGFIIDYANAAV